tara:strand:- start:335 stop:583 length:249 start_codon:yes stop_codon:yes gene_type:complete
MEIGKIVTYKEQGKYKVLSKQENSRTLFQIQDIDRGRGWCEDTKKYVGVSMPNGWYLGKNNDYGITLVTHKKHLNLIPNDEV